MGTEYRKRTKEIYGKPSVIGHDVISVGRTIGSGITWHTALSTAMDNSGVYVSSFSVPRDGLLNYVVANVDNALTQGSLNFALWKNGVQLSSGTLNSTTPSVNGIFYESEKLAERTVASGDTLQVFYSIDTAISQGTKNRGLNVRVGLTYRG